MLTSTSHNNKNAHKLIFNVPGFIWHQVQWHFRFRSSPGPLAIEVQWQFRSSGSRGPVAVQAQKQSMSSSNSGAEGVPMSSGSPGPVAVQVQWQSRSRSSPGPVRSIHTSSYSVNQDHTALSLIGIQFQSVVRQSFH